MTSPHDTTCSLRMTATGPLDTEGTHARIASCGCSRAWACYRRPDGAAGLHALDIIRHRDRAGQAAGGGAVCGRLTMTVCSDGIWLPG